MLLQGKDEFHCVYKGSGYKRDFDEHVECECEYRYGQQDWPLLFDGEEYAKNDDDQECIEEKHCASTSFLL